MKNKNWNDEEELKKSEEQSRYKKFLKFESEMVKKALEETCYICGSLPGSPTERKSICSRCGSEP